MSAITQSAILLVSLFNFTTADYECLCNYHVERAVYPDMTNQDNPLGHLYEFDCKPTYRSQTPKDWQAIQFGRKVGYVAVDVQIKLQTCPGSLPLVDAVQTTSITPTVDVLTLSTTMTDSRDVTSASAYSILPSLSLSKPTEKYSSSTVSSKTSSPSTIRSASSTPPLTAASSSLIAASKTTVMVSKLTLQSTTMSSASETPKLLSSTPLFKTILSQYASVSKQPTVQSTTTQSNSMRATSKTTSLQNAPTQSKLTPLQTMPTFSKTSSLQSLTTHTKAPIQTAPIQHKPTQIQHSLIQSKITPIQTTPTQYKTTRLQATWTISETTPLQTTLSQSVISPLETMSTHRETSQLQNTTTQILKTISTVLPKDTDSSSMSTAYATYISTDRHSTSNMTTLPTMTGSSATHMVKETTLRQSTRAPQCPPHLTRSQYLKEFGSHCYEFILDRSKQWQPAEDDCSDKAGHLVTIRNNAEQNFIYHSLRSLNFHGDNGVWIGFTDKDKEGHWRWSSGEKVTFTSWSDHQPGLLFALEDCAVFDMRHHGHWDDYQCKGIIHNHQRHGWICEYNKL